MTPTDHDLLIKLVADMEWVRAMLSNHLQSHWTATIMVVGSLLTSVGAMALALVTRKRKRANGGQGGLA